jgi:hypothetical protein
MLSHRSLLRSVVASVLLMVGICASPAQQTENQQPSASGSGTLGDIARKYRGEKSTSAPAPVAPQKSLGEYAAAQRATKHAEVLLTEKDAAELIKELTEITDFASGDTGYAEHTVVKHRIVGQEDVKRHWSEALSGSAEAQRLARSELVLKKFGYLPKDFTLKKYLIDNSADSIAGFYDFQTKTMNLVNWVSLDHQRPIMAHELTHALQDQNFDLMVWERRAEPRSHNSGMQVNADEGQESDARRAVIEGQAMVVFFDYTLKPYGRTLADTPSAIDFINARMTESYDNSLVVHNAPLIFKESAIFPYREGLMFELELLKKGGVQEAFAEAFAHPPADTHQVLEPKAYFSGEKIPPVIIPDLSGILSPEYQPYDNGTIGQLDVRVMSEQFGTENDMFTITPGWKGGSYVAVKRAAAGNDVNLGTADIGLVYVSRWKDAESAERFAEVYRKSLSKRLSVADETRLDGRACAEHHCALWATRVSTNEGPVFIEIWPDHTVFITQSLSEEKVVQLRARVLFHENHAKATVAAPELSERVQALPGFQAFRREAEREFMEEIFKPE